MATQRTKQTGAGYRWTQKTTVTYNSMDCVCGSVWEVAGVWRRKECVCETDKPHEPKGSLHGSLNLSFSSNTPPANHTHTHIIRQITPTLTVSVKPLETWKGGACLHFYSSRPWMSFKYESQWLKLRRWLTETRWPLIYTCHWSWDVWSWYIHFH